MSRRIVVLALVVAALGGAWGVVRYFPEYLRYLPWRAAPPAAAALVTPDLPLGTPAAER